MKISQIKIRKMIKRVALQSAENPHTMRGLGDAVATVTKSVGIKPCGACQKRQAWLNRVVPFKK